jgi:hypothetical protein
MHRFDCCKVLSVLSCTHTMCSRFSGQSYHEANLQPNLTEEPSHSSASVPTPRRYFRSAIRTLTTYQRGSMSAVRRALFLTWRSQPVCMETIQRLQCPGPSDNRSLARQYMPIHFRDPKCLSVWNRLLRTSSVVNFVKLLHVLLKTAMYG